MTIISSVALRQNYAIVFMKVFESKSKYQMKMSICQNPTISNISKNTNVELILRKFLICYTKTTSWKNNTQNFERIKCFSNSCSCLQFTLKVIALRISSWSISNKHHFSQLKVNFSHLWHLLFPKINRGHETRKFCLEVVIYMY